MNTFTLHKSISTSLMGPIFLTISLAITVSIHFLGRKDREFWANLQIFGVLILI